MGIILVEHLISSIMNMRKIVSLLIALLSFCNGEESNCSGYSCEELLAKIEKLECRLEYTRELLEEKEKKEVDPAPTPTYAQCPHTWTQYNGSCYLFVDAKKSFSKAESHCLELGAQLVHIETTLENEFLRNHLQTSKGGSHWIGLTDAVTEGVFKWVDDNSIASFTDWNTGEPSGGSEDCALFYERSNYKWNDGHCYTSINSICERKPTHTE